jgi:hypothetical protein
MALNASRYRFTAPFGHHSTSPFRTIFQARNRVMISAGMLVSTSDRDERNEHEMELQRKWEADIWGVGDETDVLAREIEGAVSQIEALCRPVLDERPGQWEKLRSVLARLIALSRRAAEIATARFWQGVIHRVSHLWLIPHFAASQQALS